MTCTPDRHSQHPPQPRIAPVTVNGKQIGVDAIAAELQYHPAASATEAVSKATTALVIQQLLTEKAQCADSAAEALQGETREEAQIRLLMEKEVPIPRADDQTCRRYFNANRDKFSTQPLLQVSHILVAADPGDSEASRAAKVLAEELITQLTSEPQRFGELAQHHSSCPSKEVEGNLGQIDKGQTTPEFERQVFALKQGLARHPVESRYGYHVVHIDRRVEGKPLEYRLVRERIANYLNEKARRQAVSRYLQVLLEEAAIETDDSTAAVIRRLPGYS